MNKEDVLNNLQERNDSLKSRLAREQLRHENYSFEYYKKYSLRVLNEYKKHKSLFKASSIVGIDYGVVMNWYFQGQLNNPVFRGFYLLVNEYNGNETIEDEIQTFIEVDENVKEADGEYVIAPYGDGWCYKVYVDGEKIFIISNELETLKEKVRKRNLPLDE
jgi:hypothetical protein